VEVGLGFFELGDRVRWCYGGGIPLSSLKCFRSFFVFHDGKFWGFVVCNIDRFYYHGSILSLCQVSLLRMMTCDVKC